jgi:hypothetical protein
MQGLVQIPDGITSGLTTLAAYGQLPVEETVSHLASQQGCPAQLLCPLGSFAPSLCCASLLPGDLTLVTAA